MEATSCIKGVEDLIAWRGTPSIVWSDKGTKFVCAEKELLQCTRGWNELALTLLVLTQHSIRTTPREVARVKGRYVVARECST